MWSIFLLASLSLKHVHPFHHSHFAQLCWWILSSLGSCSYTSVFQRAAVSTVSVSYFFHNSIYVWLSIITFLCCIFYFVGQFLFQLFIFVTWPVLSLEDKEATQVHTLRSVGALLAILELIPHCFNYRKCIISISSSISPLALFLFCITLAILGPLHLRIF